MSLRTADHLTNRTYYVVWVSFRKGNTTHKAIFFHHHSGHGTLFCSGYEHPYEIRFQDFYEIEVVSEIPEMKPEYKWGK